MDKRGNTGLFVAGALGAILVAGALYYFFVSNKYNHYYDLPEANEWVANYRSNQGQAPWGWLANADNIKSYLNTNPAPAYMHFSLGLDSANNPVLIMSGVKSDYTHIFFGNNEVLQGGYSCPGGYDPNSELSMTLAVNTQFDPATPNSMPRPADSVTGGYNFIPMAEGQDQIARYLAANPTNDSLNPVGYLVPVNLLNEILNQEGCKYLHVARGVAVHGPESARVIILAGVDANYNHLYRAGSNGPQVVESVYPCPICVDITDNNRPQNPVPNNLTP
jgi:hypothetical protein